MRVLTLNTGSSSLKFKLFDVGSVRTGTMRALAYGSVDSIGTRARCRFMIQDTLSLNEEGPVEDHGQATRLLLSWLNDHQMGVDAVGHRVVHGGDEFLQPTRISQEVIETIQALSELAPLHNPLALSSIRACREVLGDKISMVAVFDTAFHRTMPGCASTYALPHELASRHKITRYGFHGIAHSYLVSRYLEIAHASIKDARLITLHLGHGCSATAVKQGGSVDTSMGFTPLEGLMMGSRSGDLDPSIIPYLAQKEGAEAQEVVRWLNTRSGLVGVSGRTGDMRELLEMEAREPRARLAIDLFCYRVRKFIGAYLAVLSGADAILFSGGIGERAPSIRERVCRDMEWCGIMLDPERNRRANGVELRISSEEATCHVYVIPVDEESVIARETYSCLAGEMAGP